MRRPPYHRVDLESQLLDAASRLLADGGLAALSLRELGKAVGVSRSAAYHYFPDKATLLARVGERGFATLRDQIRAAIAEATEMEEQLVAGLRAYVRCAVDDPARFRIMFGNVLVRETVQAFDAAPAPLPFSSTAAAEAFGALLVPLQVAAANGGLGTAHPLVVMQAFWAFAHGVAELAIGDNLKPATLIDTILREGVLAMLRGFRASSAPHAGT
jgi:AcrR family transcriptional regulator